MMSSITGAASLCVPAELSVEITYEQMIATSVTVTVDEGSSLPHPLECGVSTSDSFLNENVNLSWHFPNGSEVPGEGTIWQKRHVSQILWINDATFGEDSGYYSCRYMIDMNHHSTGFSLNVRGKHTSDSNGSYT